MTSQHILPFSSVTLVPYPHTLTPSHPHTLTPSQVHRRTLYDDHRGVGEPLNETGQFGDGLIVRGRHFVVLDNFENSSLYHRILGEYLMMDTVLAFVDSTVPPNLFAEKYFTNVSLHVVSGA